MKHRISYYQELLIELLKKELKVRYKNSILGYFWSIALPLSQAILYFYAFKYIMKIKINNYAFFLIVGLFPWQWFSNSILSSIQTILGNAIIIKKTLLPRELLVTSTVLNDCFHFILSLPIILLTSFLYNIHLSLGKLLLLPLVIIIQFMLTLGISLLVSAVGVIFRDIERLLMLSLNFLFYLTPIIYDISMIPEKFKKTLELLNPLLPLIELYRYIFSITNIDPYHYLIISFIQAIIFLVLGYVVFSKLKWTFSEIL